MRQGGSKMYRLLTSEDYSVKMARGMLSRLYRTILRDLRITPHAWDAAVERYLTDTLGLEEGSAARSNEKGNINKRLAIDRMSWKLFCKGVRIVSDPGALVTFTVASGKEITVVESFNIMCPVKGDLILSDVLAKLMENCIPVNKPFVWIALLETYLRTPSLGLPLKGGQRSRVRGNLLRELKFKVKGWKIFSRGLVFLGCDSCWIDISINRHGETKRYKQTANMLVDRKEFESTYTTVSKELSKTYGASENDFIQFP